MASAIAGINTALAGVDFTTFAQSWLIQRAVERGLEIISEASRGIPQSDKANHPNVPWAQIAGIGNILRHDYQRVEPLIIWNIAETHLRELDGTVHEMLERLVKSSACPCLRPVLPMEGHHGSMTP